MASRGPNCAVDGSSGNDFLHREQVAAHYQLSALYKSRLRWCVWWHVLGLLLLGLKLGAAILDRLDIFILEIEQLHIPEPCWWEWVWVVSLVGSALCLPALRRNRPSQLKKAAVLWAGFGIVPAVVGLIIRTQALMDEEIEQERYVVLSAWWCVLVLQLHAAQLFFSRRLLAAWGSYKRA